ncbi:glycosyltransferase family 4 protein [Luteimonas sp. MC1895]|uniref:glycosyltransferase family 4 protein n=1 Tax=Luteimonas sp. MC1895 TaxID=2819513 RepID=UPI0018F0E586|nr:glycosyltransferase family 4 protein [Luteimonas sp. MC1895]MBJ6978101.1 glycosyltransferase family 4 protein [Luteimonas sp. MC1895]
MRLLVLPRYDADGASSRLRMLQYLPALQAMGVGAEVAPLLGDGYVSDLYAGSMSVPKVARAYARRLRRLLSAGQFDALWVEKEMWPWLPAWLELASMPSRPRLVVDYDDAVFHRYDQHRSFLVRGLLGRKIEAVMARADMVTVGNDYLADRARAAGCKRVEWLPTVIDLERYPAPAQREVAGPVVVGWIGSPATAGYLSEVAGALAPLQAAGQIRCVAIGARPDQVQGTPFQAQVWREDTEVEQLQQLDIGIMPLQDEPWERGKCGYKLIQYMACGLPVVASPVGVNEVIVSSEEGFLASTPEQWSDALSQLVADPALRSAMGRAGRRKVEETYSLQAQAPRLGRVLRDVAKEAAS